MSYLKQVDYPRNITGYGANPPHVKWPNNARLALSFVLNYEEGGERSILHGDQESEAYLSEIIGIEPYKGVRHLSMESIYEYGSRVGVWRLLNLFKQHKIPLTVFTVAMAAQRHPQLIREIHQQGHEICSHGLRWIDYQYIDPNTERAHIKEAISILENITGERPLGWYTGRTSPNTRRLIIEEGGFSYDSDDYNDDLPFWVNTENRPHLVIPYTLDVNDMRFAMMQGFHTGEQFFQYLKDTFDVLYDEGGQSPKMMSIGMHCRLLGRPGRMRGLQKFLDYIKKYNDIWCAKRIDIAQHWQKHHPFKENNYEV